MELLYKPNHATHHGSIPTMKKHSNPTARWTRGKWGIYERDSEQCHLLSEIEKAEKNAEVGKHSKFELSPPCLTKAGNKRPWIRKRYLVTNSKGQVYIVKT